MMGSSAVITRQYVVVIPPRRPSACSSRWCLNSRASAGTKPPSHSCAGYRQIRKCFRASSGEGRRDSDTGRVRAPVFAFSLQMAYLGDRTSGYRELFKAGTGTQLPAGARPPRHLVCLCALGFQGASTRRLYSAHSVYFIDHLLSVPIKTKGTTYR